MFKTPRNGHFCWVLSLDFEEMTPAVVPAAAIPTPRRDSQSRPPVPSRASPPGFCLEDLQRQLNAMYTGLGFSDGGKKGQL